MRDSKKANENWPNHEPVECCCEVWNLNLRRPCDWIIKVTWHLAEVPQKLFDHLPDAWKLIFVLGNMIIPYFLFSIYLKNFHIGSCYNSKYTDIAVKKKSTYQCVCTGKQVVYSTSTSSGSYPAIVTIVRAGSILERGDVRSITHMM